MFCDEAKANAAKPTPNVLPEVSSSASSSSGITYAENHYDLTNQDETMVIDVKKLDGGYLLLQVPAHGTRVIDIKRIIWRTTAIEPYQQQLFFRDTPMDNCNALLSNLGIGMWSLLEMRPFASPVVTLARAGLQELSLIHISEPTRPY